MPTKHDISNFKISNKHPHALYMGLPQVSSPTYSYKLLSQS